MAFTHLPPNNPQNARSELASTADLRQLRPDVEANAFTVLEETDYLKQIVGPRIAGGAQHPHQAF